LTIPQHKPDITAVINNAVIIPPGINVIIPIPLRMYRAKKPIREMKNMLSSIEGICFRFNNNSWIVYGVVVP
jgi:hypothetical protein